jgi:hypothetical protein
LVLPNLFEFPEFRIQVQAVVWIHFEQVFQQMAGEAPVVIVAERGQEVQASLVVEQFGPKIALKWQVF